MRSYEEYQLILDLWARGEKKKRIATLTGINRTTVRDCINRYQNVEGLEETRALKPDALLILDTLKTGIGEESETLFEAYAYLFGLYLGDGYLSRDRRSYRLRITLDTHYPNIISGCMQAIQTLLPQNKVNTVDKEGNCLEVTCYSSHWQVFFPQHGAGEKYKRPIVLEYWQQQVIETHPICFLKGLIHSDGSRPSNVVNGKDYPRYEFCNMSGDIKQLFCHTCDLLDLHWTTSSRGKNIQIARRKDVEYLDRFIGPKS
jgi:hypothetical protein